MVNREKKISENRASIRVGIKQLTSIVKSGGEYELIEGSDKAIPLTIYIKDISTGGLCIESKQEIKAGVALDLQIPKIKNLRLKKISNKNDQYFNKKEFDGVLKEGLINYIIKH